VSFYAYVCDTCGDFDSQTRADRQPCPECGVESRRRFVVTMGAVLHEHYNPAFGTTVSSNRQALDLTKIAAEEQSIRLGMDVKYELVDAHDSDLRTASDSELEFERSYTQAVTRLQPRPKRDPVAPRPAVPSPRDHAPDGPSAGLP
jgi:hypothetical protein